ncbi:hypothetical protein DTY81_22155 [Escherichia coli]|nr:hypothetical protein [Escherichia coli]EGD5144038.1 hypothetical protein [Escherichia coli]EGD6216240.1 hypothetical protein [Shigella flexneri]
MRREIFRLSLLGICAAFSILHVALCIGAAPMQYGVSQYTLRYRYVTGSGLRPDTPKNFG